MTLQELLDRNHKEFEIERLTCALNGDFRSKPIAYPILAKYGYMERTTEGFVSLDGETVINRIKELIKKLEADIK